MIAFHAATMRGTSKKSRYSERPSFCRGWRGNRRRRCGRRTCRARKAAAGLIPVHGGKVEIGPAFFPAGEFGDGDVPGFDHKASFPRTRSERGCRRDRRVFMKCEVRACGCGGEGGGMMLCCRARTKRRIGVAFFRISLKKALAQRAADFNCVCRKRCGARKSRNRDSRERARTRAPGHQTMEEPDARFLFLAAEEKNKKAREDNLTGFACFWCRRRDSNSYSRTGTRP